VKQKIVDLKREEPSCSASDENAGLRIELTD
jgi:hypothetical protein